MSRKPRQREPQRPAPAADDRQPEPNANRRRMHRRAVRPAKAILPVDAVGLVREFRGHVRRVNGIAVSGDGLLALSGGQDRTVRLWDVATGNELLRVDHDGPVDAVAMTADGRHGLSGSADKTVRLWDFRPEHTVGMRRLDGHTSGGVRRRVCPGRSDRGLGGADKTIRVWDVATGQISGSPLLHESTVVALATTGDDGVLAGCDDGTLWLWDLKSRQRVRRLKAPGPVLCVAGSPLGHRALSGHADGVLVLWDLDLGAEIGRMVGHNDLVRCAALLPDGHRALAGSQFGNLILWDLDTRRELRRFSPAASTSDHAGQLGLAVARRRCSRSDGRHRRDRASLEPARQRCIDRRCRPTNCTLIGAFNSPTSGSTVAGAGLPVLGRNRGLGRRRLARVENRLDLHLREHDRSAIGIDPGRELIEKAAAEHRREIAGALGQHNAIDIVVREGPDLDCFEPRRPRLNDSAVNRRDINRLFARYRDEPRFLMPAAPTGGSR